MEEVRIIKSIKYHIVNRYKIGEIWYKRDLCAYIATILYPFFDKIKYEKDAECLKRMGGSIKVIAKKLNSLRNRHSDLLKSYSFNGLVEFFKSELDDSILTSKEIKDAISLVDKIDTSGCVSLKEGADKLFDIIMNSYKDCEYLCEYGTFEYVNGDEEKDNNQIDNIEIDETSNTPYNENLESTQSDQEKKKIEYKICKLYENLVAARGEKKAITQYEYIWQWRISKSEYEQIQNLLCSDVCKRNIKKICETNVRCRFVVVIYIAERYKREWNGRDGGNNALIQIGLDNEIESIAKEYFNLNDERIYVSGRGREMLPTLRLEGGLPIRYIVDNKEKKYAKFAEKLYSDEKSAIELLNDQLPNQTISYSYNNKYSIFEFVNAIKNAKEFDFSNIFSDEDLEDELFRNFIDFLKKGRTNVRLNSDKFRIKYDVWNFHNEFVIRRQIVMKSAQCYDETTDLISIDRIREQWNIEKPTNIFKLEIVDNNLIKKYLFIPWEQNGKIYYRSTIGLDEFKLTDLKKDNKYSLSQIKINYIPIEIDENGKEIEGKSKNIVNLENNKKKELYFSSNDEYNWFLNSKNDFFAVLTNSDDVTSYIKKKVLNEELRLIWYEYSNFITINGKNIYANQGEGIKSKDNVIHKIAKCSYIKKIQYYKGDEVCDICVLNNAQVKKENFESENGNKIIEIKYKNEETGRYEEYPKKDYPEGLVRLQINSTKFDVVLLSDKIEINRNLGVDSGSIVLKGLEQYCLEVVDEDWDINRSYFQIQDNYSNENKEKDRFYLKIKKNTNDENYLLLEIIRPLKREDKLLLHTNEIEKIDKNIPKKLVSNYSIRIFDENGVKYVEDRDSKKYYSHNFQTEGNSFFIASGKEIKLEDNLEFVFINKNKSNQLEEKKLTIEEKEILKNGTIIKYLFIKESIEPDGVIIQSLQNRLPKLTYYEPEWLFNCVTQNNYKWNVFLKKVSALDRFKITVKHKLYFNVLLRSQDVSSDLFVQYCSDCKQSGNIISWNDLLEMSKELKVDWTLISRVDWKKSIKKEYGDENEEIKQLILNLFKFCNETKQDKNQIPDEIIIQYWEITLKPKKGKGNRSNSRKILEYIFRNNEEKLKKEDCKWQNVKDIYNDINLNN